ncbi:hypothetical protein V8F20_002314 [Naviculisporaceae sp. PSN 640]
MLDTTIYNPPTDTLPSATAASRLQALTGSACGNNQQDGSRSFPEPVYYSAGYAVYIDKSAKNLPPVPIRPEVRIVTNYWGLRSTVSGFNGVGSFPNRRKAGAAAYLRASPNPAGILGIVFEIVDALSYNIALDLEENLYNIRKARVNAMLRLERLTNYSIEYIIYQGRKRLLESISGRMFEDITANKLGVIVLSSYKTLLEEGVTNVIGLGKRG